MCDELVVWTNKLFAELNLFVASSAARNFSPRQCNRGNAGGVGGDGGEEAIPPGLAGIPPVVGGAIHAVLCIQAAVYELSQLLCMWVRVDGAPGWSLC